MSQAPTFKQQRHTAFDQMEFPQVEYREFPMAVPVVDGVVQPTPYDAKHKAHPVVIVNSQAELDALKGGDVETVPVNPDALSSPMRMKTEEDEREALYVRADQLGVTYDKRWKTERIQRAIAEANDSGEPVL